MKYNNKKTVVDGITFDSAKESRRYLELKILQNAGHITNLELQPSFPIAHNDVKICTYKGDFRYVENGKTIVEDVKSEMTKKLPTYRIKKKLVKAFYGIDIKET